MQTQFNLPDMTKPSLNGRVYKENLEPGIELYLMLGGGVEHFKGLNLEKIAGRGTIMEGNKVNVNLYDTPAGNEAKDMLNSGMNCIVSNGYGELEDTGEKFKTVKNYKPAFLSIIEKKNSAYQ
jgi:hypothetical protein